MILFRTGTKVPARSQLYALGVCSDDNADWPKGLDWGVLEGRGFEAKVGQVEIVSGDECPIAVVGLGQQDKITLREVRHAGASLARAAKRMSRIAVSVTDKVPENLERTEALRALVEGIVLGAYSYGDCKSTHKPNELSSVCVVGPGGKAVTHALEQGRRVAEAVCFARNLVNEPGGSLTPTKFADIAKEVAAREGLEVTVLDLEAISEAKMGGLLGVNRGSEQPARFVELCYSPSSEYQCRGSVALVGKGLTFDAGGLSIKTSAGMMTMKCDMSGGAAVLGVMSAVAAVAPPVKVTGYIPMTDNMLGGDATRPGDVLTMASGKTVEVLNTDAEGRLVLADALERACLAQPDAIVDLATLTGACVVALGPKVAGLMGNNEAWLNQLVDAGDRAGERVWRLPLPKDYKSQLDSSVADIKNIGGPHGGALTAGLFLSHFVDERVPWAHLDIAGPAFVDSEEGEIAKGGTGFGVRMLLDALVNFEPPAVDSKAVCGVG
ncbi:MAG: leucyl aminopeptidase [Acidimicrobiia bacterium]|nr:leucyl aminopeptidase [Acidimicrobiia bacterium]MYC57331.1 leucyl aminopeptidase [Acidimicrobiia bacterium]MYG94534.1 leucyl aminopeptidase [Acidimicrobiia bacterium]MYI31032.1 leucyl aminopeptidase [Acidimicrobiia bacterium]